MAGELLDEMQTICTQGAIEESGEKIERLKAACHTKLSGTESGTAVRISPRRLCHLVNLQLPVSETKRSEDSIPKEDSMRKDLRMKTDKELESMLDICAVQFHLVLSMKRYMTPCIVI